MFQKTAGRKLSQATLAAALLVVAVPFASADYDRVHDERGDSSFGLERDFLWATHEHTVSGKLKHVFKVAGTASRSDRPFLEIDTPADRRCPEYLAGKFGAERAGVYRTRCEEGAGFFPVPDERSGDLDIEKAGEHRLRFLFRPAAIGKPSAYDWRFAFRHPQAGRDDETPFHRHVLSRDSGENGKIAFHNTRARDGLFKMDPDGSHETRLTHTGGDPTDPDFSPKGTRIVFTALGPPSSQECSGGTACPQSDLFLMRADGSDQRPLTRTREISESGASFSPSDAEIVFSKRASGVGFVESDIYVVNDEGGQERRLTHNEASDEEPAFSPSGEEIVFVSDRSGGDTDVFLMRSDGTGERPLLRNRRVLNEIEPTFSPNGRRIAFYQEEFGVVNDFDIWIMRRDGTHARPLLDSDRFDDLSPDFSPNGKRIVFARAGAEDLRPSIFKMRTNGTHLKRLTRRGNSGSPDWGPRP